MSIYQINSVKCNVHLLWSSWYIIHMWNEMNKGKLQRARHICMVFVRMATSYSYFVRKIYFFHANHNYATCNKDQAIVIHSMIVINTQWLTFWKRRIDFQCAVLLKWMKKYKIRVARLRKDIGQNARTKTPAVGADLLNGHRSASFSFDQRIERQASTCCCITGKLVS